MTTTLNLSVLASLTSKKLEQLAESPAYFERGTNYYLEGHVINLEEEDGIITGLVAGQDTYEVRLWEEDDAVAYECDCPLGEDGEFCKHCVAVGLAWMNACKTHTNENITSGKVSYRQKTALTGKDIERYLQQQDKVQLVEWLMEQVRKDKQLAHYFKLQAARDIQQTGHSDKLAVTYRETIKKAIDIHERDFIEYRQARAYQQGVWVVVNGLQDLLEQQDESKHAQTVVELIEFALQRVEKAIESVDDSNGGMGDIMNELKVLHHEACKQAEPDPGELAKRLFDLALQSQWDNFSDSVEMYADVLGASGLEVYQKLAEERWQNIPAIGPGEKNTNYQERSVMTQIMEDLAKRTGDVEALVLVKSKKLEYAYNFLEIAQIYEKAKQPKKALEWAERGLLAFSKKTDQRLRIFLANQYHRLKRHDEAMALIWMEFTETPRLDRYQLLQTQAFKLDNPDKDWRIWREKALAFLREHLTPQTAKNTPAHWYTQGYSELVEIFLWEKDAAAALREAELCGCSQSLWLQLAAALEKSNPSKAIQIYQEQIDPIVSRTNNDAYKQAFELLKKIRHLMMEQDGHSKTFQSYLATVRQKFQPKRNFMKLLESLDQ